MDKKWMYTSSRRKKMKISPAAPFEDPDEVAVTFPKVRSRRFPTKVMYMGIIAPPSLQHNFDGKIMMKRISAKRPSQQEAFNNKITDNAIINELIESGGWKDLVSDGEDILISDLIDRMQDTYQFVFSGRHELAPATEC